MALNLNGTTGISGVDGSNSAPAIQGADSNTGLSFGTDEVNINTAGSTRATVTSNGRISLTNNIIFPSKDAYIYSFNGGSDGQVRSGFELSGTNNTIRFFTSTNENARFTNNANGTRALYINQTSEVSGANSHLVVNNAVACVTGSTFRSMYMSGNGQIYWWNGTNQPYISTGGVFTDASDVSLKKDITDLTYGIDSLKNLKPRKYKMKADDKEQIGFVAQEVESVIPEVIDTSDTPNGDRHKGLAYGHLTAVLTKALQEAVTKIETLETKVTALEAA